MNTLLYAGTMSGGGAQQGNPIMSLLPFLLIILVMYLLMIRPQAKKQKEKQQMLKELKPGDEVLTIGGIYGKIEGVREKEGILIVRVAKDIKIHVTRSAIAEKLVDKSVIK
ncbi:MAG: preprotein translocase subunit YajC [Candidatus Marinimicrobia bacterium]|nr:preprotein translocase subunit YajC [Candidatus Neomarinimicrobiota bacterium]RKY61016.1 MAG: preprotein translocase subunit YajC [Candidatus Neomarinimicrobiota bacterium]